MTAWTPYCPCCGLHKDQLEPQHFARLDLETGTYSCPNGGNTTVDEPARDWLRGLRQAE